MKTSERGLRDDGAELFEETEGATKDWDHPTKGTGSFERDHQECTKLVGEQAMDMDPHSGRTVGQVIDNCLQQKGYRQ